MSVYICYIQLCKRYCWYVTVGLSLETRLEAWHMRVNLHVQCTLFLIEFILEQELWNAFFHQASIQWNFIKELGIYIQVSKDYFISSFKRKKSQSIDRIEYKWISEMSKSDFSYHKKGRLYEEKNVVYYLHQYCKGHGFEFHSCLSCVLCNCNDQLCLYIEYSLGKKSETKQNDF